MELGECERDTLSARGECPDGLEEGTAPLGSVQTAEPGLKEPFFKNNQSATGEKRV